MLLMIEALKLVIIMKYFSWYKHALAVTCYEILNSCVCFNFIKSILSNKEKSVE